MAARRLALIGRRCDKTAVLDRPALEESNRQADAEEVLQCIDLCISDNLNL
jgi:hypothetical protein